MSNQSSVPRVTGPLSVEGAYSWCTGAPVAYTVNEKGKIYHRNGTYWLIGIALVVGVGCWRILWGDLWGVMLSSMLGVILVVVLLWAVSRVRFLFVSPEWHPGEVPLGLWGILIMVTLLVLRGVDEGHVGLGGPPSSVYAISSEKRRYDHETSHRDSDACASAQLVPANPIIETDWESKLRLD